MSFNMYVPVRFVFGNGRLSELHKLNLPGKKAMVVISCGKSTKENGSLDRTLEQLSKAGVAYHVFDEVEANPLKSTVMAGAKAARDSGCDFIIALGGGSVMDASKAMAGMATNEGDIWDYISGGTGGGKSLVNDPLPVICITTTAGTGSEADQWGVVSNDETSEKIGFGGDDRLFPVISIVDPELMKTVPPAFTAYQGFDAFLQAVECYISKFANLMSDMLALKAIEDAAKYLPRAVKDGNDLEAREHMAFANTIAGIAMTVTSTTAEHSIEHAMSAYHQDLPHGAGLIMVSKAFHGFFVEKHACDQRFIDMAKAMGMKDADKPQDFITALEEMQKACNVADLRMSDYGISPDEFDKIATNSKETMGGLYKANPYEMTHDDVVEVLRKSYR